MAHDTLLDRQGTLRRVLQTSCGLLLPAVGSTYLFPQEKRVRHAALFLVAEEREVFVMSHTPFCFNVPCYRPVLQMCGFLILAVRMWGDRHTTLNMILASGSQGQQQAVPLWGHPFGWAASWHRESSSTLLGLEAFTSLLQVQSCVCPSSCAQHGT